MAVHVLKQRLRVISILLAILALLLILCPSGCSGESPSEFQIEGRKLMEQNNPSGAVVFFKNAMDKDPNDFSIRFDLGKAYLQMGKLDQAENEFKKCLRQQEANLELHLELARLYTQARKPKDALTHIAKIEQAAQPSAETRELAALNFLIQRDLQEAEKALKESLGIDDKRRSAAAALIRAYLAQKRPDEALVLADKLLEAEPEYSEALRLRADIALAANDMATAEKHYRKLAKVVPNDAGPLYMLGTVLLRTGNIEEAKRVRDTMRSRFQTSAFDYMLSGMIAFQEENYPLASTMFQNSVDMAPTQEGYYRLAVSLNRLGNLESALSNLRRILDLTPRHAPALHLTAQILLDQKRLDEAQIEAENLVAYHPDSAPGYYLLGTILNAKSQTEPALEALQKALQINPTMSEATMRRSSILMAENRTSEAVDELSRALDVNAGNIAARTALFNYYMGKRDFKKTDEIVREGLEELPGNALLLTLKASSHAANKDNFLALEALEQARKSDPDFLPALNLLLRLHMLTDRNEDALIACEEYLKRHPDATDLLIINAALLDRLGRQDEARQRLEKASGLGAHRALVVLVRREIIANQPDKAEQYLLDALKETPSRSVRSLVSAFYIERKLPEKALAIYDALAATEAEEAAIGKYNVYLAKSDLEQARLQAEEVARLDPQSALGPLCIAGVLEKLGKREQAFEELESSYRRLQDTQLLVAIGNLCLRGGQYEKAESYFQTALRKNPDNLQALMGQGGIKMRQKQFGTAVAIYGKALELAPEDITTINNLAMALAEEGKNVGRAADLATKAFVTSPENAQVVDTLGFCLLADKRPEEAIVILKNGIRVHPDSAILHYRYGTALLSHGQKKEGVAAIEKALALGEFSEKENAQKMLRDNN